MRRYEIINTFFRLILNEIMLFNIWFCSLVSIMHTNK